MPRPSETVVAAAALLAVAACAVGGLHRPAADPPPSCVEARAALSDASAALSDFPVLRQADAPRRVFDAAVVARERC